MPLHYREFAIAKRGAGRHLIGKTVDDDDSMCLMGTDHSIMIPSTQKGLAIKKEKMD